MRLNTPLIAGVLWSGLWGVGWPAAPAMAADPIAIVANELYPATHLTLEQVRDIYLGRKTIEEYLRIRPVDQADPQLRKLFLEKVLNLSKEAYIDYWNRHLFQKGGLPPLLKNSSEEVVKELLNVDGSIGYLWHKESQNRSGLKVLLIVADP